MGESAHGASFLSRVPYPARAASDARRPTRPTRPTGSSSPPSGLRPHGEGYEEKVNASLSTSPGRRRPAPPLRGILFDRDATLVVDVPYNGDASKVEPMPTALDAVARAREAGLALGVVTNQSGIARGIIDRAQADAVNARVDELFGGFDVWMLCPHGPEDGCDCRKPAPGMVLGAADALGLPADSLAVIGDIGADVGAAVAAGARGVIVPTPITLADEVAAAPLRAATLLEAVELLLAMQPDGESE
ncbi:HAD-IIIA family hydrolase [Rathayibacter sp. VKM Ac-2754]|nr:HAD-IIIA family hydrolase [Rathayibacter sp. VKM Ac-2754]